MFTFFSKHVRRFKSRVSDESRRGACGNVANIYSYFRGYVAVGSGYARLRGRQPAGVTYNVMLLL